MNNWRIGAVSYLNSKPLVYQLTDSAPQCSLLFDLPSNLADQLSLGELDVALVPSIEASQHPGYRVVSDACIACCGPVWSVKLLSRVPLAQIRSIALDEGSRTSAILVQILLKKQFDLEPDIHPLSIDENWHLVDSDAVLIIGDRAMKPQLDHPFSLHIDMGQWWYDWTGLPFVFALWVAREDANRMADFDDLGELLSRVRDGGLENSRQIALDNAIRYGLTINECNDYFRQYLHFRLGSREKQGLWLFQEMAAELGLACEPLQLQFNDC